MICARIVKYGELIRMSASSRLLAQIFLVQKNMLVWKEQRTLRLSEN